MIIKNNIFCYIFVLISFPVHITIARPRHKKTVKKNQSNTATYRVTDYPIDPFITENIQLLYTLLQDPYNNKAIIEEKLKDTIEHVHPHKKRTRDLQERINKAQQEVFLKVSSTEPTPIISFIIPCYNRAHCVSDTIESIYLQQLSIPFEIIVVDDCSTDDSFEILKKYEKQYNNFYLYQNPRNKGAPATRNNAIIRARGIYICNADSDDIFEPNSIAPMLEAMIAHHCEMVFFEELRFFTDNNRIPTEIGYSKPPSGFIDLESMLRECYITVCAGNRIFTKDSWLKSGGFVENEGHDTWTFSFKLLANQYTGYVHPSSGYLHRIWSNKEDKWCHDEKNKVNDISPLIAISESPELFTPHSLALINNYKQSHIGIVEFLLINLKNKQIMLIPENQLNPLLKAYFYENQEKYDSALEQYLTAISNEISHYIVYLRAADISIRLGHYHLANTLITKILPSKNN